LRQFESASEQVAHNLSVLSQGAIGPEDRERVEKDTRKELKRIEHLQSHPMLEANERKRIARTLHRYQHRLESLGDDLHHKALNTMNNVERTIITRVCSLIYEYSGNQSAAKHLIDRILSRLK
jgi:hypothetical protein